MSCNALRPKNTTIVKSLITCEDDVIKLSSTCECLMHDAPGMGRKCNCAFALNNTPHTCICIQHAEGQIVPNRRRHLPDSSNIRSSSLRRSSAGGISSGRGCRRSSSRMGGSEFGVFSRPHSDAGCLMTHTQRPARTHLHVRRVVQCTEP